MSSRFVIVDDDAGVRRIIQNIIEEHELGTLLGESSDGLAAEEVIREYRPDIAIVDLLLPGQDGVALIQNLNAAQLPISYIMISESGSQSMITQAYAAGIEFYIHKPLNALEIVSVIRRVQESRNLKRTMSFISQATSQYAAIESKPAQEEGQRKNLIYKVFSDLGILGEAGAKNIYQMTELVESSSDSTYQLLDVYRQMSQVLSQDTKTIEQRVRRTITKALQNLASLGVEDYHNDKFQSYSTSLFDFSDVRQEMNFIQGKSPYHGKINVKKFVEGLIFLAITRRVPRE